MKTFLLTIILLSCAESVFTQSQKQIRQWLYNLPIKERPEVIKKAIKSNNCFEDVAGDSISFAKISFIGKIIKPQLTVVGPLDSSKVRLMFGKSNAKEEYYGFTKVLKFEYFSADSFYLDTLFDAACLSFKKHSKKQLPSVYKQLDGVYFGKAMYKLPTGEGREFVYKDNEAELSKIAVLRLRHPTGAKSIVIEFTGSTTKLTRPLTATSSGFN